MPSNTHNNYTNWILAILEFKTWYNHLGNSLSDELNKNVYKNPFMIIKWKYFHKSSKCTQEHICHLKSFGFNVWN